MFLVSMNSVEPLRSIIRETPLHPFSWDGQLIVEVYWEGAGVHPGDSYREMFVVEEDDLGREHVRRKSVKEKYPFAHFKLFFDAPVVSEREMKVYTEIGGQEWMVEIHPCEDRDYTYLSSFSSKEKEIEKNKFYFLGNGQPLDLEKAKAVAAAKTSAISKK